MSNIKKFRIKSFKKKNIALKLENINLSYEKKIILENFNFQINSGEIAGLLGPNGAGKTSIFNLIIGLIKPNYGSIFIKDENVNEFPIYERTLKFQIGFVPQYGGFFSDLTVFENLKAISEITIKDPNYRDERVNSVISEFELDSIKEIKASFLSGGQKKKLVIAISLISDPKILLLDEPFAALDLMTIKILQEIIVNLQSLDNLSIILCDHQARDLLACVDEAAIVHNGRIVAKETPSKLIQNIDAKNVYFGESFKIN